MTERKKSALKIGGIAVFIAGATWATDRASNGRAADLAAERYVTRAQFAADSARRDREYNEILGLVRRIDSRVAAIYCADKPPGCQ